MEKTNAFIFGYECDIRCCCYLEESWMAFSTDSQLVVFDFWTGKSIAKHSYRKEQENMASPIGIKAIKSSNALAIRIAVQDKFNQVLLFQFDKQTNQLTFNQHRISIPSLGFTKLAYLEHSFQQNQKLVKKIPEIFISLNCQHQFIETYDLGTFQKVTYSCQDSLLGEATFIKCFSKSKELKQYLLIAEEGCRIRQFILSKKEIEKQSKYNIQQHQVQLTLPSQKQIKIITCIELANHLQAIVCLRDDYTAIICLETMCFLQKIQSKTSYRFACFLPLDNQINEGLFLVGKNKVNFFKKYKLNQKDSIFTKLILDVDILDEGIIGVTENKCIFYLGF